MNKYIAQLTDILNRKLAKIGRDSLLSDDPTLKEKYELLTGVTNKYITNYGSIEAAFGALNNNEDDKLKLYNSLIYCIPGGTITYIDESSEASIETINYTLTYLNEDGSVNGTTEQHVAEDTITLRTITDKPGYAWVGLPADGKMPAKNLTLKLVYTAA